MNKSMVLILVALLSVSVISDCHSEDNMEGREEMTIDGKVVGVDVSRSTITIKTANELTFSVPINTSIISDIYDIELSDIEPGDDVTVEHYEDSSGKLIATKITVENKEM